MCDLKRAFVNCQGWFAAPFRSVCSESGSLAVRDVIVPCTLSSYRVSERENERFVRVGLGNKVPAFIFSIAILICSTVIERKKKANN